MYELGKDLLEYSTFTVEKLEKTHENFQTEIVTMENQKNKAKNLNDENNKYTKPYRKRNIKNGKAIYFKGMKNNYKITDISEVKNSVDRNNGISLKNKNLYMTEKSKILEDLKLKFDSSDQIDKNNSVNISLQGRISNQNTDYKESILNKDIPKGISRIENLYFTHNDDENFNLDNEEINYKDYECNKNDEVNLSFEHE